jgi:Ca-activated chloride channel homolog
MEPGRKQRRAGTAGAVPITLLCLLVSPIGSASGFKILRANPGNLQVIRSETDLVVLPVTVTDRHGRFVSGLTESDFRVYENGQLQSVTDFSHLDVPVTVGLIVDSSGSMQGNRPEVAEAAKDFLSSSNAQDQIFVVNFNEHVRFGLPPDTPFTNKVSDLEAAVFRGPSTGLTALYDAVAAGLKQLAKGANEKKALIVISDGGDNASHETFRDVLNLALHGNAIIYAIGLLDQGESDVNPGVLRKLAKVTGGRAFFPQSAVDLAATCQQIAQDLREQYRIAYAPSDARHDGTYRAIRVSVHAPGKGSRTVRTRAGYFAPSGSTETPENEGQ